MMGSATLHLTLYQAPLLASALVMAFLAGVVWRRRAEPVAGPFFWMAVLGGAWDALYALDIAIRDLPLKIEVAALRVPVIAGVLLLGVVSAFRFAGRDSRHVRAGLVACAAVYGVSTVLALTSPFHTLWRYDYHVLIGPPMPLLGSHTGWWFAVHVLLGYSLTVTGVAVIVRHLREVPSAYTWRTSLMLTGLAVSFVPEALFDAGYSPIPGYNIAPSLFGLTGLLYLVGTVRYRVLEVVPIARGLVVEQLRDAVFVLDGQGRVVDANRAAQQALGLPATELIGQPAGQALARFGLRNAASGQPEAVQDEVILGEGEGRRVFEVALSTIQRGHTGGWLVVLHDITDRELAREVLRAAAALDVQREAEERTRREIAELLHGRVQTQLLVLSHQLADLTQRWPDAPPQAHDALRQIREKLDRVREQEVRLASHRLYPSLLGMGLTPALHTLGETYTGQFEVSLVTDELTEQLDAPFDNHLPMVVRESAYRVVEEALANVAKHAEARHVTLSLGAGDGHLTVTVHDDGRGFDPTEFAPGLGLRTIAARVTNLGGAWQVNSAPGAGTTYLVTLPVTPPASPATRQGAPQTALPHSASPDTPAR